MNKIILLLVTSFLTSCATSYHITTNLDKDNFNEYFAPSKVKVFANESDINAKYQYIGLVEGQSCQQKSHHAEPDLIEARTNTRLNAYKMKANAIVFTSCTLVNNNDADKHCVATRVCFGKALKIINE